MKMVKTLAAAVSLLGLSVLPSFAAEGQKPAPDMDFSFEGPFGKFDRGQLQRGYLVYKAICADCHSMRLLRFRNLGEPGGPEYSEEQVKALAASFTVTDGPNDQGEMFERPGLPSDAFKSPFPNEQAARQGNGGSLPPDLSLITKSRPGWYGTFNQLLNGIGGPEYVNAVLIGYEDVPTHLGETPPEGKYYNPYFGSGHWIGMPPPLTDGDSRVEFSDGTANTAANMARDVSAFLAWAAEPKMEERKQTGFMVVIYLAVLAVLLYLVKKKIWARVEH